MKLYKSQFKSFKWFFEPRDIWIGLYWKRYPLSIDIYICPLPMLPINIYLQWELKNTECPHGVNYRYICHHCNED
jgi:hypothetical protein